MRWEKSRNSLLPWSRGSEMEFTFFQSSFHRRSSAWSSWQDTLTYRNIMDVCTRQQKWKRLGYSQVASFCHREQKGFRWDVILAALNLTCAYRWLFLYVGESIEHWAETVSIKCRKWSDIVAHVGNKYPPYKCLHAFKWSAYCKSIMILSVAPVPNAIKFFSAPFSSFNQQENSGIFIMTHYFLILY